MKKHIILACLGLLFARGQAQQVQVVIHVSQGCLDTLYHKYPVRPFIHTGFSNCFEWDTPYFQSIADVKQHLAMVVHGVYTKQMSKTADSLNYARKGVMASWRHLPDMPNEDNIYTASNVHRTGNSKMDKGHFSAWELNAYSKDAALLSDTYTFNAAFEMAAQNTGTELGIEYFQRLLEGALGSLCTFTYGHIVDNYPAIYWNLLKYGGQLHAY